MGDHDEDRVQTLHPDPKKSGPRILRWKYEAVRRAIGQALERARLFQETQRRAARELNDLEDFDFE